MSNPALAFPPAWKQTLVKASTVLWWALVLVLAAYFFRKFGLRYFTFGANAPGGEWPEKAWLLVHIVAAAAALFLGPTQFWTGLRQRYVRIHRWLGRAYLGGIAVATVAAIGLFPHMTRGWGWKVAIASMAVVWVTTTLMAYVAIRRRRTKAHREWMIRSYVVTFQFVVLRLLFEFPYIANAGGTFEERLTAMLWVSWVVPLFFTEVVLQWRSTVGPGATASASLRSTMDPDPMPRVAAWAERGSSPSGMLGGRTIGTVLAACVAAASAPSTAAAQAGSGLEDVGHAWTQAFRTGDAARIATYFADDLVAYYPSADRPTLGRGANQEAWAAYFTRRPHHPMAIHATVVAASDDLGYMLGQGLYSHEDDPEAKGGRFVAVWRRLDGEWKVVVFSAHSHGDVNPATFHQPGFAGATVRATRRP